MGVQDSLEEIAHDGLTNKGLAKLSVALFAGYVLIFLSIAGYFINRSNDLAVSFYEYVDCNEDRASRRAAGDHAYGSCRLGRR